MEHLEEILSECAKLRGVTYTPHRTLREFSWFVSACIFGEDGTEEEQKIHREYGERFNPDENPLLYAESALLEWGRLFLEYCREEYGEN